MSNAEKIHERLQEVKNEIAAKAAQDPDFRSALIDNPQAAIEAEYSLEEGALGGTTLSVVEEAPDSILIPIPPDMSEVELTDEQLDKVAGGFAFIAITTAVIGAVGAAAGVAQKTRAGRQW